MKKYINKLAGEGTRVDGRKFDELRTPIKVETGISNKAEGSARVTWGETIVMAGVKMGVGVPYPDSEDSGVLITGAELSPMSDPNFLPGPPGSEAIEIARIVDRGIRESKMMDMKKLCIRKGELVWTIFLDIYTINNGGNLIDASSLAAVAALKNAVFPKLEKDKIKFGDFTKTKIPLKLTPITSTIIKIGDKMMIDPSYEEGKNADARLSVSVSEKGDIHSLQKGGSGCISIKEIDEMLGLAIKKSSGLRKVLK